MKFAKFICVEALVPRLESSDRDAVIEELVVALDKAGRLGKGKAPQITKALIKRENEASTGMGKGMAVPHIKHDVVKNVVATVGLSANGIEFAALDKEPVHAVILLISPTDNPDQHLQAMEHVFKYIQQEKFRRFLCQCQTVEELADLLQEADETPSL